MASTELAENMAAEAKALKQLTFPEMDSDGLPSSYIPKVLACLGKWQLKMQDLGDKLNSSANATLKP